MNLDERPGYAPKIGSADGGHVSMVPGPCLSSKLSFAVRGSPFAGVRNLELGRSDLGNGSGISNTGAKSA